MSAKKLDLALRIKALVEGLKDVDALTHELQDLAKTAGVPMKDPTDPIEQGARETKKELTDLEKLTKQAGNAMKGLAGAAVVYQFLEANKAAESLNRTLVALTGSQEEAAAKTAWLKETANELGVVYKDIAGDYVSITAAAKGTNMEGAKTDRLFRAITGSMALLGRSGAQTSQALQAVSQMLSKGSVSAEELRQQLGEALPGTMDAAAKALGVPADKLADLIATGDVVSEQFLPAFTTAMETKFGLAGQAVTGFAAETARMQNAVGEAFETIGKTGVMTALSETAILATYSITGLTLGFDTLGKKIGAFAAYVTGALSFEDLKTEWADLDAKGNAALDKIAEHSQVLGDGLAETTKAAGEAGDAANDAAGKTKKLADAGKEAAEAGKEQAGTYFGVKNALTEALQAADRWVKASDASVKTAVAEAHAQEALAGLFATRAAKEDQAAVSSRALTAAREKYAADMQAAADIEANYAAALETVAKAQGEIAAAQRKAIQEAKDKALASQQAAEAAAAEAEAARNIATAATIAATAMRDNSAALVDLAADYKAAQAEMAEVEGQMRAGAEATAAIGAAEAAHAELVARYAETRANANAQDLDAMKALFDLDEQIAASAANLDNLRAMQEAGAVAAGQHADVTRALAEAQAALSDGYLDAAKNAELKMQSDQRDLTIGQARIALAIDETERLRARAVARGEEAYAMELAREAELASIEAIDLAAEAKARDAENIRVRADNLERNAILTKTLTAETRAQIDAMRDSAEMADIESERMRVTAATKREAADRVRDLADANRRLQDVMHDAGVQGINTFADIRGAINAAANGPELQALADGLEAAIQAGVDKAGELSKVLAEVRGKMEDLNSWEGKKFSYAGSPAALAQRFKPGEEDKIKEELGRMWDNGKGGTGDFGKFLEEVVLLVQAEWKKKDDEKKPERAAERVAPDRPAADQQGYRRVVDINLRAGTGESATVTASSEDEAERVIRVLRAAKLGAS